MDMTDRKKRPSYIQLKVSFIYNLTYLVGHVSEGKTNLSLKISREKTLYINKGMEFIYLHTYSI